MVVLAAEFARRFAADMGKRIEALDAVSVQHLRAYAWPGNVRELQNVIERAVITARGGEIDLARALPDGSQTARPRPAGDDPEAERIRTVDEMRELERANITRALEAAGWKVSGADGAARRLGMKPSTLNSRMAALGIERPAG